MKKLLFSLLICLAVSNAAGMDVVKNSVRTLQEGVSKKLASLPHGVKIGAGAVCNQISGISTLLTLVFMNDKKHFTRAHICCAAATSVITGYLGHQIYKYTYTHEAQLAEQKAKDQKK
jgi:hypothetical protein